jgi:hypothetical protein
LEKDIIREIYERLERKLLIMIALPLPVFTLIYLKVSDNNNFMVSGFWTNFLLALALFLLLLQYINHQKAVQQLRISAQSLEDKLLKYEKALMSKYWLLFLISWICSLGLFLSGNQIFSVIFALTLIAFSLGKAMPRRIINQLKLKGQDKDRIEGLSKRIEI